MRTRATMLSILVLLAVPALADDGAGLMTYERFLEIRHLDGADLECINPQVKRVFNPRRQAWDSGREVCEVWVRDKVIPAKTIPGEPVKFKDGRQVFRTVKEWTETTTKTVSQQVARQSEFVVKVDEETVEQKPKVETFMRYVVEGP